MKLNQCCCFTPKREASPFSSPREKSQQKEEKPCGTAACAGPCQEGCPGAKPWLCRLWGGWSGGWGREAKLQNLGSQAHVPETEGGLQSTSACRPESIAGSGDAFWAGRKGSDAKHGTSPADGGHGPSCTQAAPVAGESSLWIAGATGKGKSSITALSCQWSTLGRSGATSTESLHISKVCWSFSWSPQPVGSGAGLNSSQHSSLA